MRVPKPAASAEIGCRKTCRLPQRLHHPPACTAGLRVNSTLLTAKIHTRPMRGETKREKAPSGAQNPPLSQVVPPSKTSNRAAIPAAKSGFEISPARQSPNVPAMMSMARGKDVKTTPAHKKSFRLDVRASYPEPATE